MAVVGVGVVAVGGGVGVNVDVWHLTAAMNSGRPPKRISGVTPGDMMVLKL